MLHNLLGSLLHGNPRIEGIEYPLPQPLAPAPRAPTPHARLSADTGNLSVIQGVPFQIHREPLS